MTLRYRTDPNAARARGSLNPYAIPAQNFSTLNASLNVPSLSTGFLAGFLQSAALNENRRIAESQAEDAAIARGLQEANLEAARVRLQTANRALAEQERTRELEVVDSEIRREAAERLRERIFNGESTVTRAQAFENEYYDIAINHENPRAAELLEGSLTRLDAQSALTSERRELIQDRRNENVRNNFLFGENGVGVDANGNPNARPASSVLQEPDADATPATNGLQGQTAPATVPAANNGLNVDRRRRNPDGTLVRSTSVNTQANEALAALTRGTVQPGNPLAAIDSQTDVIGRLVTNQAPVFGAQNTQNRLATNLQQLLSALGTVQEVSV